MNRAVLSFLNLVIVIVFCACRTVVVSPADELTSSSWQSENLSGITGTLTFSEDTATLKVSTGDEVTVISGALAIDSSNFYITATEFYKTYTFSYKVYHDRADITYMGDTLTFVRTDPDIT